jgi:hypothetical protein
MLPQSAVGFLQGGGGATIQNAAPTSRVQSASGANINRTPIYTSSGGASNVPSPAQQQAASAAAAQAAATAKSVADFNSLKSNTYGSINEAIGAGGKGYLSSLQDYLDSRKQTQNQINQDSVQNELAREQGMQGVLDMVGNGIRSGGITLANENAGTSSAGEALARAYGVEGRQQASSVGNQAAQGQNKIDTEQSNLALADTTERRHANESKTTTINNIISNARNSLGSLNQMAMYASIPDRVNIEAKIAQVKQDALDKLSSFDSVLSGGISRNTPEGSNQVRAQAANLLSAGVAPAQQFDYTSIAPPTVQGTGPSPSSLPIYVASSGKKQTG